MPNTRKSKTTSKPTTYPPPSHVVGTAAQAVLLDLWTAGMHPNTRRFLLHVVSSRRYADDVLHAEPDAATEAQAVEDELRLADRGPFIPVPMRFIEKHFRNAEPLKLEESGILEITPYSHAKGRCREFRLALAYREKFADAGITPEVLQTGEVVNLMTGKPTKKQTKSILSGPSNNGLPPLIRGALKAIGTSRFDRGAVEAHIDRLRATADELPAGSAKVSARSRWINDRFCFQAVLMQSAAPLDAALPKGVWTYEPAYRPLSTGRIGQIGGGFQSCSKAMKAAAFSALPDFHNYDLRASQVEILIVLFEEAGIDPSWLVGYIKAGKQALADEVELSVGAWKAVLYAVLMGARIPALGQIEQSDGSIRIAIQNDVGAARLRETYKRFLDATKGLRASLRAWHKWLDTIFLETLGKRSNIDGTTYITNASGIKRSVEDLPAAKYKRQAVLAAFLLQGREAAFIHALTMRAGDSGFDVLSNEHDGLAVLGLIPDSTVWGAALKVGLPRNRICLVQKSFVD